MRIIVTVIALALLSGCASNMPVFEEQDFGTLPSDYKEQIREEFDSTVELFDPYSAHFTYGAPRRYRCRASYGWAVVLKVNAKNRYGAYIGNTNYNYFLNNGGVIRC